MDHDTIIANRDPLAPSVLGDWKPFSRFVVPGIVITDAEQSVLEMFEMEIDMQFLADVYLKCEQCRGTRYRREILNVTYRGRNIADVLEMTVRQAFSFFRGQKKVQMKLKRLMDVGLDYLRLGQPANTLSAGEAQRLKLASHIVQSGRRRTLFLLDEPTTGLHFADVVQLLDCFDALLSVGHSLIIVEHSLQLMKAADYIIDLGPGASADPCRSTC